MKLNETLKIMLSLKNMELTEMTLTLILAMATLTVSSIWIISRSLNAEEKSFWPQLRTESISEFLFACQKFVSRHFTLKWVIIISFNRFSAQLWAESFLQNRNLRLFHTVWIIHIIYFMTAIPSFNYHKSFSYRLFKKLFKSWQ